MPEVSRAGALRVGLERAPCHEVSSGLLALVPSGPPPPPHGQRLPGLCGGSLGTSQPHVPAAGHGSELLLRGPTKGEGRGFVPRISPEERHPHCLASACADTESQSELAFRAAGFFQAKMLFSPSRRSPKLIYDPTGGCEGGSSRGTGQWARVSSHNTNPHQWGGLALGVLPCPVVGPLEVAPGGAVRLPHGHTRHGLTWGDAPPAVGAQEAPAHNSHVAGAGTETAPPARLLAQGTTPYPQPRAGKPRRLPHVGYGFPAHC